MSLRVICLLLVTGMPMVWRAASAYCATAEDAASPSKADGGERSSQPLQFRRVLAPAGRVDAWPTGGSKYLPIEASEFERLLGAVRNQGVGAPTASAAHAVKARYEARWEGDHLVAGQGEIDVALTGTEPAFLPLEPCNLVLDKASWTSPPNPANALVSAPATTTSTPAVLGSGPDGRLLTRVERSGRLQIAWTIAGKRDASEGVHFLIELPRCPLNQMTLELPSRIVPIVDAGMVTQGDSVEKPGETVTRWNIELGGNHRVGLRLAPPGASAPRPLLALLRESCVYDLSPHGLELSAQWKLQAHNEPLNQVTVVLDPGVQLATAQCGEVPLTWSSEAASEKQAVRVVLSLPEPIQGTERVLRLAALTPLVVDQPWRLPRIRPEGLTWQEGEITLQTPDSLVIHRMSPSGCAQTDAAPLPLPRLGQSATFRCFREDGNLEIELGRRTSAVQCTVASDVLLDEAEIAVHTTGEFRLGEGVCSVLDAAVAQGWRVHSVESIPAGAIADWEFEPGQDAPGVLTIRLAQPVSANHRVRCAVAASREKPSFAQPVSVGELLPIRFGHVRELKHWVLLRGKGTTELKLGKAEQIERIDPARLPASEADLFPSQPEGLVFAATDFAKAMTVSLAARKPKYSAAIRVEAAVGDQSIRESYVFRCVPESERVDRIFVKFYPQRDASPRWTLGGEGDQQFTAKQLTQEEQAAAGLDASAETWEIALRRPRSTAFEISATREAGVTGQQPLTLASVPEAIHQRGSLSIVGLGGKLLQVENRRLEPIPPESTSPDRVQAVQSDYRYDPVRDTVSGPEAAICVTGVEEPLTCRAWIWKVQMDSWFAADGAVRHRAVCEIQNFGSESIQIDLAEAASPRNIRGVWVDGDEAVWSRVDQGERRGLQIGLPSGRRFPVVEIEWTASQDGLGFSGTLTPPKLEAHLPVLSRRWIAWLPSGYRAAGPHSDSEQTNSAEWPIIQRLFSPLCRGAEQPRFNPFSAEDWRGLGNAFAAPEQAVSHLEPLLKAIGHSETPEETRTRDLQPNERTWGNLLTSEIVQKARVKLLIDHRRLAELGISTTTQFRPAMGDSPMTRGMRTLQEAGLSLWLSEDALVLTTQAETARQRDDLSPIPGLGAWQMHPRLAASRFQQPGEDTATDWIPAEAWRRRGEEPQSPWTTDRLEKNRSTEAQAWSAYRIEIADSAAALEYVHQNALRSFAFIAFLAMAIVGWTIGNCPRMSVVLLGAFVVAALLLPFPWTPIASALAGGLLLSLAIQPLHRSASSSPSAAEHEDKTEGSVAGERIPASVRALTLGAAVLYCAAARGDEPSSAPMQPPASAGASAQQMTPPRVPSPTYRVIVPIDDEKRPVGDKVYLPEPFYQELHRRAGAATEQQKEWLIVSAVYRGALAQESASGRIMAESLKVQYDLHVFGDAAQVRIPFSAKDVNLVPNSVTLDGRVVQPEWNADATALLVHVAGPGPCRLELTLQPTNRNGGKSARYDLEIPPVANSRLELSLPDNVAGVEAPTARGEVRLEQNPPRLSADLGPADRLTILWRDANTTTAATAAADVEQLMWLRVLPGSVVIHAKFKLRAIEGQVQQIRLSVDQRLRLLPLAGNEPPMVTVRPGPQQTKLLTLRWQQPVADHLVFDAAFLLTETSGVGNFRLPELELADARSAGEPANPAAAGTASPIGDSSPPPAQGAAVHVGRRWLAVTVDPALDREETFSTGIEVAAASEFMKTWGGSDPKPQSAYRLVAANNDWTLATRPHEAATAAEESLAVSIDQDDVRLAFRAQLTTSGGYVFQHRLAAPTGLQIDRVSLIEENVERAGRWSQEPDGAVTVFLTGPVSGRQQLSLDGRLPMAMGTPWPVPRIHVEHSELRSTAVQLFRRPTVQLTWQSGDRSAKSQSLVDPLLLDFGRFAASYHLDEPRWPDIIVTAKPNDPQIQAQQVLSLRGSGRSWSAKLDCSLQVKGGMLDQIYIQAPAPWNGPYSVSVPGTLDVVETPSEGRQLLFRPRSPMMGSQKFSISGPLELARGDRPASPNVLLRNIDALQRWVVLPDQSQNIPMVWQTRGLRRCEKKNRPPSPIDPGCSAYVVAGDAMQAILLPSESPQSEQFVRLADISLAWSADGASRGIALFDIEPGGATECPLRLPPNHEVVQVLIDGASVMPRAVGEDSWRIPLSSKRLPQRVEVVFRGRTDLPNADGQKTLQSPTLGELPVLQTLWTIAGPSSFTVGVPRNNACLSVLQQQWLRFKEVAAMSQSAFQAAADSPDEVSRWYPLWIRRLTAARMAARREMAASRDMTTASLEAQCKAIDDEQALLAERLDAEETYRRLSAAVPAADNGQELWEQTLAGAAAPTRCSVVGGAEAVTLDYRPIADGSTPRWIAALALGFLALLLAISWNRSKSRRFLQTRSGLCYAALGIGWWLWLWPSVLGLVILTAGLLSIVCRLLLPRRRSPSTASA